ncbi:hypothetical protein DY000_02059979 [Brassica cretica]|uniref:Uncharacterized protein n=1 Tax=Brassica cretica TaxID=69181 RepID=A0ABQ7AUF3_BRACR|nr:hypothetical protein DY000_02059979 [Brassica cretica]
MLEIYSIPTLDMSCSQLTARGELATELTTRTMDMLRMTNLGILCLRKSTRVKTESKNGALGVFLCHGVEDVL